MTSSTSSARHSEVRRDVGEAIAGLEPVDEVLDPGAAVNDERLPERRIADRR